ncbi:citrate synthase [Microbacterium sp. KR10-403]|uniref:citrate synthase n=1 Tax=Microbacterium sp. KR10-403 TaxID=3158581 RepID=UPI0032E4FC96
MPATLTAEQTAHRLGIKPATLYAYVSRGMLRRERTPAGSLFDPLEVEEFAARRRRGASPDTVHAAGSPLTMIDTDVAVVLDDELFLRGRNAARLAATSTLQDVARELWGASAPWPAADADDRAAVRRAVAALPVGASHLDRLRTAVIVLAARDPLRAEASIDAVRRAGVRMLLHLPDALSATADGDLWSALTDRAPDDVDRRALQAALILTVDHDLAVSTMAARMAATARGSGYAIVSAALGAFDSPLHGTAADEARMLLRSVLDGAAPDDAIAAAVSRTGRGVPGFGHPLYAETDARAATLLPLVAQMRGGRDVGGAVAALTAVVEHRTGLHPNIDLALAAFTLAAEMPTGAATAIFALGRVVGWVAHGLAEYAEAPMRLRPRGRYVGPLP